MMRLAPISLALLLLATPAWAGSKTDGSRTAQERAERSFEEFARSWMKKVHGLEAQQRGSPTVTRVAGGQQVTYRGYGSDYRTELRSTGRSAAPYVGLLHYEEQIYSCTSTAADNCRVSSRVPVTEIFRYQAGRWSY